jgi:inhibitor of cysteine peptidase
MSNLTLTRADNGSAVAVPVGGRLVVRLDENPATGYRWALEPTDAEVVTLQHVEYVPSDDAGVGGGGQRTWTFIARTPGVASLHLKLWRAWEGDASISARFTATLHIRE